MITKERLEELIQQDKVIYGTTDDEELLEIDCKFLHYPKRMGTDIEIKDHLNVLYTDSENDYKVFEVAKDNSNIFETKDEAEFYAKYGNVEKTVKMPVPPTWEEFILKNKEQNGQFLFCIKINGINLYLSIHIGLSNTWFIINYKDFSFDFENTKNGYLQALDKMVELWRE